MQDLEFVQRCIKGDKLAWNEFIDRYSRLVYNYIYSVLKVQGLNPASFVTHTEDIFQEIFCALLKDNCRKLRAYKGKNGCSLASWLRIVSINATIDYLRRQKPAVSLDEERENELSLIDTLKSFAPPALELLSQQEKLKGLRGCIDKLKAEERHLLELHLDMGLSLERVKDVLGVSRGAIDMRKARILEKLKDCFKKKGFELDF
ncbi:MAG: sigma-70 family RNA polymerase sigma factor [Candidatus Omnitrophica bacterium]|nr:sigma-70 family RNA polymerase sigma factor [Candidatus Omnitrophota bacterium]